MEAYPDIDTPDTYQKPPDPIKFIYIEHSSENYPNVWREAKAHDIILCEYIGITDDYKKDLERLVNSISSLDKKTRITKSLSFERDGFMGMLIHDVIVHGKELHLIDTYEGSEGDKENLEFIQYYKESKTYFKSGFFDLSYNAYSLALLCDSLNIFRRNQLVANQVEDLIRENENKWKGKKVCVIQGQNHRQTYRYFKTQNPSIRTSRSFQDKSISFSIHQEAQQRAYMGDGDKYQESAKRSYICNFIVDYQLFSGGHKDWQTLSSAIARSLSNHQTETIFAELRDIQQFLDNSDSQDIEFRTHYVSKHLGIIGQSIIDQYFGSK